MLSDYTEPLSTGLEAASDGASTGTLPPPRPNQVDWRMAVRLAVSVAIIAAGLSLLAARVPPASLVSTLWIVSASLTTLSMYQRRRPLASMNAGIGARIGTLVGVALVFFLGIALAAGMAVARFWLHSMSTFDAETAQALKAQIDQLAASRPIPPDSLALIQAPEFRVAMMLTGFGIVFGGVFLISIFGGAIGGLLRRHRVTPKV